MIFLLYIVQCFFNSHRISQKLKHVSIPYLSHARVLMKFFSSHELSKNVDDNFFHSTRKINTMGLE